MIREIVHIDEDLCDGCGQCVPSCHEGALRIVDGKARLVSDRLCDGLGACLGHCPRGAVRIERRAADAFDEQAVAAGRSNGARARASPAAACEEVAAPGGAVGHMGGCPGSRFARFERGVRAAEKSDDKTGQIGPESALTHWPVQLRLLSPQAPVLNGASLLVAADCVPVASAEFHTRFLPGRAVVIGCPKFDDVEEYVARLTEMMQGGGVREIVVARMEVPCCGGIVAAVIEARRRAGTNTPVTEVIVGTRGKIIGERSRAAKCAV
jgi:NAD-dependent dihydropyrimidine dehydrogenase PreA subunit